MWAVRGQTQPNGLKANFLINLNSRDDVEKLTAENPDFTMFKVLRAEAAFGRFLKSICSMSSR